MVSSDMTISGRKKEKDDRPIGWTDIVALPAKTDQAILISQTQHTPVGFINLLTPPLS
jgi:hypothetical protein